MGEGCWVAVVHLLDGGFRDSFGLVFNVRSLLPLPHHSSEARTAWPWDRVHPEEQHLQTGGAPSVQVPAQGALHWSRISGAVGDDRTTARFRCDLIGVASATAPMNGGALSHHMRVEKRLAGGAFGADRRLDSVELAELGVGCESVPPRFEGRKVFEVNHEVTGR